MSSDWAVHVSYDLESYGGEDAKLQAEVGELAAKSGAGDPVVTENLGRRILTFQFASRPEAFSMRDAIDRSDRHGLEVQIVDPASASSPALDLDILEDSHEDMPTVGAPPPEESGRFRSISEQPKSEFEVDLGDLSGQAEVEPEPTELELFDEEADVPAGANAACIAVFGVLNGQTGDILDEKVSNLIVKGTQHVILNMRSVTDMDSAGAAHLVACQELLDHQRGSLRLVLLAPGVETVLLRLNLGKKIPRFESREKALEGIGG